MEKEAKKEKKGPMPLYAFRSDKKHGLSSRDIKILVEKGLPLFEAMDLTDEAEKILKLFPELDEVIKKWVN